MKKNPHLNDKKQTRRDGPFSRDKFASAALGDETLDALFGGDLKLYQTRRGYRFSLDSVLLADFATVRRENNVIDLGTGSGVMPLILAYRYPSISVTGVEIQREMADRATRNVRFNGYEDRVSIACMDIASAAAHFRSETFDLVICNPPYRRSTSGRLSPSSERQIARHELKAGLDDFVGVAAFLLKNKGCFACIQLGERTVDLLNAMRSAGIEPKRLRVVHPFADREASMILVEAVKNGRRGLNILPPLIVYDADKTYTAEINAVLRGRRNPS